MTNYLKTCLECASREKPYPPIPRHLAKIHQAVKKLNPKFSQEMNQIIDQRWK